MVLWEGPLITGANICLPKSDTPTKDMSFKLLKARAIEEFEISYVQGVLSLNEGNISKAARAAKKNRRAFWQLMRKHNIVAPYTPVARHELGQIGAKDRTILS